MYLLQGCSVLKNGEFEKYKKNGTAVAYGWYVWVKGFKGKPVIEWV